MTTIYDPAVLSGKRILITGGGTGLGRGVAAHLVAHGAEVHLWGRRMNVLEEAAAEIGPGAHVQAVDVRDADAVDAAVGEIWSAHGPLTGLINNAAANFIAPTKNLSARAFNAIASTVMNGSFNTTHAVGKRWIEGELPGSVVSTLTSWVWTGSAFVVPSAMAKAAVHAMTMSLAVEWGRYGIRLNAIAAGPIPTDYAWEMLNPTSKSSVGATQADQVPLQRFGTVEELANLNIFLLSDACHYLTGHTIAMDGGQHLAGPGHVRGPDVAQRRRLGGDPRAVAGRVGGREGAAHDLVDRHGATSSHWPRGRRRRAAQAHDGRAAAGRGRAPARRGGTGRRRRRSGPATAGGPTTNCSGAASGSRTRSWNRSTRVTGSRCGRPTARIGSSSRSARRSPASSS